MSSSAPGDASLGIHSISVRNVPIEAGSSRTWSAVIAEYEAYIRQTADTRLVFGGITVSNSGEVKTGQYTHRFMEHRSKVWYAKIQDFVRGARAAYDDPHLAMLTFTTTTTTSAGAPRPPVDHLEELLRSWRPDGPVGVYYELKNRMEGTRKKIDTWPSREWQYMFILETTTDKGKVPGGYGHVHVAVVADGEIDDGRLEGVIDKHLELAPGATGEAHELDDAIDARPFNELDNPGAYVGKYLGEQFYEDEAPEYLTRFNAVLWETGRRRVRVSDGAQGWIQREDSETGRWEFLGACEWRLAEELADMNDLAYARRMLKGSSLDELIEASRESDGLTSWGRSSGVTWEDTVDVSHEEFEKHGYAEGRSMRELEHDY